MLWIKSGIENPSKSDIISRCGGDEMTKQNRQKSNVKKINNKIIMNFNWINITMT